MPTKATDNRETGFIVISAAAACAGLYLLCKDNKDAKRSAIGNFCEVTAGFLLIGLGAAGVLASKEGIKLGDKLLKQLRGDDSWL